MESEPLNRLNYIHSGVITLDKDDYAIVFQENGDLVTFVPDHKVYVSRGEYHFGMTILLFQDTEITIQMQKYLANLVKITINNI
jgi:hypothetical protein